MRQGATAGAALLALLATGGAHAAGEPLLPSTLHARALAAGCAACHGTDGRAADGAKLPGLAGQPRDYLVQQMKAFKRGDRAGTVMPQLAKGYSDAQIEQLAAWFAKAPR
jgi:cytochrome subunit of sulfide dehydrogenase